VTGAAKKDCPCIKADDARIKEKKRLQKEEEEAVKKEEAAQQKAERSLLVRISAIEKTLWGKEKFLHEDPLCFSRRHCWAKERELNPSPPRRISLK